MTKVQVEREQERLGDQYICTNREGSAGIYMEDAERGVWSSLGARHGGTRVHVHS